MSHLESSGRAGFFIRAVAFAIDALIVLLAYIAIMLLVWWNSSQFPTGNSLLRLGRALFASAALIYMSTEMFWAASFGKLLLRLRIRSHDGTRADFALLSLRWSTKQLPWIMMLLLSLIPHPLFGIVQGFTGTVLLAGTLAALNDDHLAWHDQWSGTSVCHVRPAANAYSDGVSHQPAAPALATPLV